jgi:hypothetical protein
MKNIISVLALFLFYGCRDMSKGYIYEIYQNGVKIDENCRNSSRSSFSSEGSYYKKTDRPCKIKRDGCGCFGSSNSEEKKESSGEHDIEEDFK